MSRQSSTWTPKLLQVPVAVASSSDVGGFHSEPRPASRQPRRTQSSTAVHRHHEVVESVRQNGSVAGRHRLGSTYDEGDYDPVDSSQPAVVKTPLSTSSLQRRHGQTVTSSSSSAAAAACSLPRQQQQQQSTSVVRGHRRTRSTGFADVDQRAPAAQVAYNDGSLTRVRVEVDHGRRVHGTTENWNQQQATATRRQANDDGVMVVTNVGYEPTTLQHQESSQTVVRRNTNDVVHTPPDSLLTSKLNGDRRQRQTPVLYGQTSTIVHQHVQSPSYATLHRVDQTTGPGSSVFQRAVMVDASQLVSQQQQQQQQRGRLDEQLQQQEMLLKQQQEEMRRSEQPRLTPGQDNQRQADTQRLNQRQTQYQQQVVMRQHQSTVAQNLTSSPNRLRVTEVTGNGPSRSSDLPASRSLQTADRRQSPGNFSTSSSGSFLVSGSGDSRVTYDEYIVRLTDGGRGDVGGPVMRRGTDTPSSVSSAASWRRSTTSGGTQQRFSTASSSCATEQSSVELGNDSSLDRASPVIGQHASFFLLEPGLALSPYILKSVYEHGPRLYE